MVQNTNINFNNQQHQYGNLQRIGNKDGRTVYRVIDPTGEEVGKMTVATNQADTFEKAYIDMMKSAPQIQKFALENSTPEAIQKKKNLSKIIVGASALTTTGLAIYLSRKTSTIKQILSTIIGAAAGLVIGLAGAMKISTPPGAYKFSQAGNTISKLDIQAIPNENVTADA